MWPKGREPLVIYRGDWRFIHYHWDVTPWWAPRLLIVPGRGWALHWGQLEIACVR